MAYLGGKAKGADHIFHVLNNPVFDGFRYIEPFCGYLHIARRVERKKTYTVSDNNRYLITLLKHIQTSTDHPHITEAEYQKLRANPSKDPLRAAYAAFCYSYNGKFFGGYVNKYKGRNYPAERKKYYNQLHENPIIQKATIRFTDYTEYLDEKDALIYCDPPYAGTTEYHSSFDSDAFWEHIRKMSKQNYVFVSEYTAPPDFLCVSQKVKRNSMNGRGATRKRVEKLFVHESKKDDPRIQELIGSTSKFRCKGAGRFTRRKHR